MRECQNLSSGNLFYKRFNLNLITLQQKDLNPNRNCYIYIIIFHTNTIISNLPDKQQEQKILWATCVGAGNIILWLWVDTWSVICAVGATLQKLSKTQQCKTREANAKVLLKRRKRGYKSNFLTFMKHLLLVKRGLEALQNTMILLPLLREMIVSKMWRCLQKLDEHVRFTQCLMKDGYHSFEVTSSRCWLVLCRWPQVLFFDGLRLT